MDNTYNNLVDQLFQLPKDGFEVIGNKLQFHGVDLSRIIEKYGTPLKITYLPKVPENIAKARKHFEEAKNKFNYQGEYTYCYCTKSNHFSFVLNEVLKNDVHLETSSAYDMHIIDRLIDTDKISKETYLIHNGYKRELYIELIGKLIDRGFNSIPVLDNMEELDHLLADCSEDFNIGLRIATGEDPQSNYYTSRLGIRRAEIPSYFNTHVKNQKRVKLKMLHFFIDSGIEDNSYYWNELAKCVETYCQLRKTCPDLHILNIGGGFPVKYSLVNDIDHQTLVDGILLYIKETCETEGVPEPDIFTEFGSYTVAESGAVIYSVIDQKKQNDVECWNMIDSSFITTLPDTWAINQRFILLPINRWDKPYERVNLGGLTCDSLDHYNQESHDTDVFLPRFEKNDPLYIGFFHTGAYQQALGGYGGIQHCLIPSPKQIVINRDSDGTLIDTEFASDQNADGMMQILGY